MKHINLPNTNITISQLSLGCMSFHTESKGRPIIEAALDLGINFFDTADLYDKAENEKILAKVLAQKRKDVIIATKVGNRWRNDGKGWDWVPRKKYILKAVEASLSRLNTDYIDLYQLHGGTIDDPLEEVIEAFELLKEQGKIRAYGISSIRPNTIRKWTILGGGVSCMSQYSLLDRRPEEFVLDYLQDSGQKMLVRGALAKGLLAGKTPKSYGSWSIEEVAQIQTRLQGFSETMSVSALALHFVLSHPAVGSVVLGASNVQQLKESVTAYEHTVLTTDGWHELSKMIGSKLYEKHR